MNETKALTVKPDEKMVATLERLKPQLRAALPRSMDADRFARVVMTEIRRNPKLLECTPQSFLAAVFTSAQIGLEIGGHLGEAFITPFKNRRMGTTEATLIVGYKGLVKLMWESEQIASLSEVVVHAKDHVEYRQGDGEAIIHQPYVPPIDLLVKASEGQTLTAEQREALTAGPAVAYYCIIEMKNGGRRRAFMWVSELLEHQRLYTKDRDDSVWRSNPDAMRLKTVIRKAAKLAPRAVERPSLQQAIALDELAESGVGQGLMLPPEIAGAIDGSGAASTGLSLDAFTEGTVVGSEDDAKQ